ncbi:MAG: N-acetylmuramoyl-L-alanine amidase [Alicyclobacillaceae bacterium]|nr:N-acetylmuramoyl-L-alanine amidase [Alicyclobacillaceae bacterium]
MGAVAGWALLTGAWGCGTPRAEAGVACGGEPGLVGRVIVVDAGHGGPDSGAVGQRGLKEKDITLPVALHLAELLRQAGAVVYLTRTTDTDLADPADRAAGRRHQGDLRRRLEFTRSKRPDAFVSIHCNAVPESVWRGAHTIYMRGNAEGKRMADDIQASFRALLLPTSRQPDDMSTLYLLKRIAGPAVLAEVGFLSNPQEAAHLATDRYQRIVALSLYTGLLAYFGSNPQSSAD